MQNIRVKWFPQQHCSQVVGRPICTNGIKEKSDNNKLKFIKSVLYEKSEYLYLFTHCNVRLCAIMLPLCVCVFVCVSV